MNTAVFKSVPQELLTKISKKTQKLRSFLNIYSFQENLLSLKRSSDDVDCCFEEIW